MIQKEYEDFLSIKTVIEECNKRIQKLETDLFNNKENIDIEFVEKEIALDNKELAIQQNDLQELINKFVFDETLLQEKYLGNQSLLKASMN